MPRWSQRITPAAHFAPENRLELTARRDDALVPALVWSTHHHRPPSSGPPPPLSLPPFSMPPPPFSPPLYPAPSLSTYLPPSLPPFVPLCYSLSLTLPSWSSITFSAPPPPPQLHPASPPSLPFSLLPPPTLSHRPTPHSLIM